MVDKVIRESHVLCPGDGWFFAAGSTIRLPGLEYDKISSDYVRSLRRQKGFVDLP